MINVYRLPTSSTQGLKCCLIQYNVVEGKVKGTTEYRKELFSQIKQYLNERKGKKLTIL